MRCLVMLCFFVVGIGFGCRTTNELTPAEMDETIAYARKTLMANRVRMKLTSSDEATILKSKPDITSFYSGYKEGGIIMKWHVSNNRTILVSARGKFFEKTCFWRVKTINKNIEDNGYDNPK